MVDEVTPENGPLEVVPGSHRGELHSLWHDGQFTGSIDDSVASKCQQNAVRCVGPAGSVCLMHTRLLHGSAPNLSSDCRTLFICVYSADDALPLVPSPVPTEHEGLVVRGVSSNRVRAIQVIPTGLFERLKVPSIDKGLVGAVLEGDAAVFSLALSVSDKKW